MYWPNGGGIYRAPNALNNGGSSAPSGAALWVDNSGNVTVVNNLTVSGTLTIVGAESFTGLVTFTSSSSAGAAGALGPEETLTQTTEAATGAATIKNPGYHDFEAQTWNGSASVAKKLGRFGAVVDTIDGSGVPTAYRFVWTNIAGTIIGGLGQGGALTLSAGITRDGHSLWTTDNTYDIGASGATRPRDLYLGRTAYVGTSGIVGGTAINTGTLWQIGTGTDASASSNPLLYINGTGSSTQWAIRDSTSDVEIAFIAYTQSAIITRTNHALELWTNNTERWEVTNAGHLVASGADNTYDIGATTATRPRNLFLASGARINESGADYDTIISGDTVANLVYVDAGLDSVGFGAQPVAARVEIHHPSASKQGLRINDTTNTRNWALGGGILTAGQFTLWDVTNARSVASFGSQAGSLSRFNPGLIDVDFVVDGTAANLLWCDAGTSRVGINNAAPSVALDVTGSILTSGQIEIDGALDHDGTTVGFYGVTPVTRATAYTQTYATADKTHANFTSADLATTAATQTTPWGFATQAQAENIATQFNLLRADVADIKQLVNSVIDDLQAIGILQ